MAASVATGSGQSGYPGQMGHFFSRSRGSRVKLKKSGFITLSNIAVTKYQ